MRQDILLTEYAKDRGFTVSELKTAGESHTFTRDNLVVWEIRDGWQTAYLIDNHYKNHLPFTDLKDALNRDL